MNIIDVIKSGDYLILDTETTGLGSDAEICQIAIINSKGETLLDTLVKPVNPIPEDATRIHGITNEMVAEAQPFPVLKIQQILSFKNVVVYNADYDSEMLYRSELATGYEFRVNWRSIATFHCAMKHFAPIYGDWNDYRKSYRWKSLSAACAYYKIPVSENVHSALADCLMTLEVCKAMAASEAVE